MENSQSVCNERNQTQLCVLGIDPGSRSTGYGIITLSGNQYTLVKCGNIQSQVKDLSTRLYKIHKALTELLADYQPHQVAIEQIFTCHNPQSALKLGQARGVALAAAAHYALPVFEYSARQVKQAVVGYGAASKHQVQQMVTRLLNLTKVPQADAADALAIALCHANSQQLNKRLEAASSST